MRRLLPRIYKHEVLNLLLPLFLVPATLREPMRIPGLGPAPLLNWAVAGCYLVAVTCQFLEWRQRQDPGYWRRLNRSPRRPFPLDREGRPIDDR
ncbi:hypothetical protein [Paracraurococcus lichenis]|uniref:DUF3311 domain-containing protein n=1 Tax=Paracraurococcus lichenis TaxID=3064888 RepID=A0ABT9E7J9_9PROT|nr:hypothetical protein [Paracraurococcus sp. LOR1-02]MDO9712176.1 hypothetical protein [Paracraurococcus sp. LOR1-02]